MDKLKLQTPNKSDENFKKLSVLFPNAVTETINENGELVRAIDKDILMQEINTSVVEGKEERYQFTWPDKKKSILLANSPISKTLRPCREESVDFDNTENLYIEGDNLEVLKLLQETYLGKIKMIYIDPPYNTGNDFVYNDDFSESSEEYLDRSGQFDDEGNRLVQNTESNGRFHTDWLNMIYPRLRLAKDLLSDDGVIFISIDDNEQENLKKVCDEVFGESNFISTLGWQKVYAPKNQARHFSNDYEFVLCYSKLINKLTIGFLPRTKEMNARYKNPDNDFRGDWKPGDCVGNGERKNGYYDVISPTTGKVFNVPKGKHWVYSPETMEKLLAEDKIYFGKDGTAFPSVKQFLSDVGGRKASSLLTFEDYGHTDMAKKEIQSIFNELEKAPFDTPKPIKLIKMFSIMCTEKDSIIIDFFSGSSTTAHAVMQLNAEDGGNRKFIMVQLPEKTDEKSEAYKAGYKNICEIGKERIRRAGKKIVEDLEKKRYSKLGAKDPFDETKELWSKGQASLPGVFREDFGYTDDDGKTEKIEYHSPQNHKDKYFYNPEKLDIGFRVLKCDTTNMKDVYYSPAEFTVQTLDGMEDNIKEDRTEEDLLFQVMLDLGVLLSSRIEEKVIDGKRVFVVGDENYLAACFDENITEETVTEIAKMKPYYFVMRDSSMASDSVAANFEQIFEAYSPTTVRKVL